MDSLAILESFFLNLTGADDSFTNSLARLSRLSLDKVLKRYGVISI